MAAPAPTRVLVHKLADVFRRAGFDGASLTVLSRETGLGRASLYHHFPGGKAEMAQAVYTRVSQDFTRAVLAPLAGTRSPEDKLDAMVAGLDAFYAGGRNPCLLDVFTLGAARGLFAEEVAHAIDYWSDAIARVLVDAGVGEDVARARAERAIVAVEGALVIARASGRLEPFARTLAGLADELLTGATAAAV